MTIDLDAPIVPGITAGGITIGQSVEEVLRLVSPDITEQRIGCRVLKFGPVWVFAKYRVLWGIDHTEGSNTMGVVD